jgi:hypothetical protein
LHIANIANISTPPPAVRCFVPGNRATGNRGAFGDA